MQKNFTQAPFIWRKLVAYPSYPGRAVAMKISYSSLQNLKNCLREKKKTLAWPKCWLTQPGDPFSDGKVTVLAEPARSKRDHQNMRERCCKLLAPGKWVNYKSSLKLTRLGGEGDPFSRGNFSP